MGAFHAGAFSPAFFVSYLSGRPYVSIGGVGYAFGRTGTAGIFINSLTVNDREGETPNTCQFTAWGFTPALGSRVVVALAGSGNPIRQFAGVVLSRQDVYLGQKPSNYAAHVSCIDDTWQLNKRKVITKYLSESATDIAQDLIATYCPGFTSVNVEAALPSIDEFTLTNEDVTAALNRLAKRIGGYWYLDYFKDLHFFLTETGSDPVDLTPAHPSLSDFVATYDLSQVVTRVYVEGGGSNTLAAVPVGASTMPVIDAGWYPTSGMVVCGPQRITYTGKVAGGPGTGSRVVGLPQSPGAPSASDPHTLGGLVGGGYKWKISFVFGSEESEAGTATGNGDVAVVPDYSSTPTLTATTGGNMALNSYYYVLTYVTSDAKETQQSISAHGPITLTGVNNAVALTSLTNSGDARVSKKRIYRGLGSSGPFFLAGELDNTVTSFTDNKSDAELSSLLYVATNNTTGAAALSSIPTGGTGCTGRRIWRTVNGGSVFLYTGSLGDNSATTFTDTTADTELGEVAPAISTVSQALAASTLRVVDLSVYAAGGGWVLAGNNLIRYTGRSGSSGEGTLTGVPTSGLGSIASRIVPGVTALVAPHLTGIPTSSTGSILFPILADEPVNLLAQVDDTAAQTTLAALLSTGAVASVSVANPSVITTSAAHGFVSGQSITITGTTTTPSVNGSRVVTVVNATQFSIPVNVTVGQGAGGTVGLHNGIQDDYLQDNRLSYTESAARGTAHLALRSAVEISVSYKCRDPLTRSGRTIHVDLPAPQNVLGDFKIQTVTIGNFPPREIVPPLMPTYTVQASSTRYSLEDLLRSIRGKVAA